MEKNRSVAFQEKTALAELHDVRCPDLHALHMPVVGLIDTKTQYEEDCKADVAVRGVIESNAGAEPAAIRLFVVSTK